MPTRFFDDVGRDSWAVVHGSSVGHGTDGCEPARCRRARTAFDSFRVFKAWFTEMHVHIDEPGRHDQASGVEHFRSRRRQVRAYTFNESVLSPHIGHGIMA